MVNAKNVFVDGRQISSHDDGRNTQTTLGHRQLQHTIVVVVAINHLIAKLDYLRDFMEKRLIVVGNVAITIHCIVECNGTGERLCWIGHAVARRNHLVG